MTEQLTYAKTLPEAYHNALILLDKYGDIVPCPDYNTEQKEISMTIVVAQPLEEPMISKLFIGGYKELQQYVMEMRDGILDFEVDKGNWKYTYHDRMVRYPIDNKYKFPNELYTNQLQFIIDELRRNSDSRRAVIDIRDNSDDMYSDDPACLQHIQFFIRDNKLHMKVLFRSNDACKAAFMNMFALIMIQKYIADSLGIEVGTYTHRANSFHCYARDYDMLTGYIKQIKSNNLEDIIYTYKEDWENLMTECIPEIEALVDQLKER